MQIKKRYIKEEIERLEKVEENYRKFNEDTNGGYSRDVSRTMGRIAALIWVLGFADD